VPFLVTIFLVTPPALADEDLSGARDHYKKGSKAFELGLFDEAIREYMEAYRLKDDPAILYNLGQAHRLAKHPEESLHFYKMYLTKYPNSPNRDEVLAKIEALQKLLDQQRATQTLPPDHPISQTPSELASPTPPAPTGPNTTSAPAPSPAEVSPPGRAKKIAGIVVGVVGVAGLGAGIAFGVLAKSASDDLSQLNGNKGTFDYDKQQTGKTDQLLEGVLLGIGGAALAAGTTLFILGHRDARRAAEGAQVWVVPALSRGVAALQLSGRF
jgi:tetratricopeptide (TPR) repeat protein